MLCFTLVAFFSLIAIAFAQTFDASNVDDTTKEFWCNSQECDPDTLDYECVCTNGRSPNSTEYSLTIPYFECQERNTACVRNCGQSELQCQDDCNTQNPCGARKPRRNNRTTTASASSTTSTSSPTGGSAAINGDTGTGAANMAAANFGAALLGLVITAGIALL
ncbi:MAG: hypothetical protein M1831_000954 [Alyxoria varia]|nr:MAG: hypothetical protein M1831_000954 [Alyxoria varia]